jgi:histidinol phosphatase-like enzyme
VTATDSLVIDDKGTEMRAAQNAGVPGYLLSTGDLGELVGVTVGRVVERASQPPGT